MLGHTIQLFFCDPPEFLVNALTVVHSFPGTALALPSCVSKVLVSYIFILSKFLHDFFSNPVTTQEYIIQPVCICVVFFYAIEFQFYGSVI